MSILSYIRRLYAYPGELEYYWTFNVAASEELTPMTALPSVGTASVNTVEEQSLSGP